ncbi:hypothetical protein F4820DRAFT_466211 [Hypoxylon rubiginosum]|uniref:Uncharacterized protein n=1 Tax=Hypoxylon rubiginosum TaxID=110542 RepID=A0ACB9YLW9_9PEZI|nr:hypothetical protein F4820DRAFT_466211 [Hypoxylon rubiginosum]
MPPFRLLGHNILKLTGFYFEPSGTFPSEDMANRIYNALLEDTIIGRSSYAETVKKHTTNTIHILFRICLRHIQLFRGVWGGHQFWDTVSEDCPLNLNSDDLERLVRAFVDARRKYQESSVTKLTRTVDQWISQIASQTSQFNDHELGMLEDPKIIDDIKNPVLEPLPPGANNLSSPTDLKRFLCMTALENIKEHSSLAIYLTPIGFCDDYGRSQWHNATGSLSKVYGTADEFVEYAQDCFANRRKGLVVGVFNHWLGMPHQVIAAYTADGGDRARDEFWAQRWPRKSIVIVLQKIDDRRIDVKLFDPTIALRRRQPRPPPLTMLGNVWKTDFMDRVQETFTGGDSWHGGDIYEPMSLLGVPLQDDVEVSCAFVWTLATGDLDVSQLGN